MTSMTHRGTRPGRRWLGVLLSCLVSVPAFAAEKDVNVVKSMRAVDSEVEIEVHSSREFPVRDQVVILRIGKREFSKSRPPDDGSLHTLIFHVPADEFAQLADGDPMTVQYGRHDDARDRWDFGPLSKAQLAE